MDGAAFRVPCAQLVSSAARFRKWPRSPARRAAATSGNPGSWIAGIPASDILEALDFESLVVMTIATDMISTREISETDYQRLQLARQRINAARSANGQR